MKSVSDLNALLAASDAVADGLGYSADSPQQCSPPSVMSGTDRGGKTV